MAITKAELGKQFAKDWQIHYALNVLKERGFSRKQCKKCGKWFWTSDPSRVVCGDSTCVPYSFIGKVGWARDCWTHDYVDTWREFARFFQKHGRTAIPRYPTIARWRDDTWFVQASIYDFQPHVVSGESAPPANPLVIAQPCLRFNDIENIGVTNRHMSSFVMLGQHNFISDKRKDWKEEDVGLVIDCLKHFKIPEKEITFVESVWMGGGCAGPCFEVFVGGMEVLTAVFMQYAVDNGLKELPLKIIDFGWGLERLAWLLNGTYTSYEIAYDPVDKKFAKQIGFSPDKDFLKEFSKVNANLDLNETNIDKALVYVSKELGLSLEELKKKIKPIQAFYSILDHSRTLLFALADGALPSNSGGGYNLRVLLRRALRLAEEQGWDIDLKWLVREHAQALYGKPAPRVVTGLSKEELLEAQLMPMYPELRQALPDVEKILDVEVKKYTESKAKAAQFLTKLLESTTEIGPSELIKLYESQGILPEDVAAAAAKIGKIIKIPSNFYSQIASSHAVAPKKALPESFLKFKTKQTELLYYKNDKLFEFDAKVLEIVDNRYVVLDKTAFYPTSGGQHCDLGVINDVCNVLDVYKQGNLVIHEVEPIKFKVGDIVTCKLDVERRQQLMRHHTATHILNGICRRELGNHIWQAGAEKTVEKARLDITHYQNLSQEELRRIEALANEVVLANIPVQKYFLPRAEAEKKFGMRIYQGGAVPGAEIRIVEIPGLDVEACGGIHCDSTLEVGPIKILGSKKIQDGIIRLEFAAGKKALEAIQKESALLREAAQVFSVQLEQLPNTCARFFKEWKEQRKELAKFKKGLK
ncbi:MAG: alanine--tRNA ligase [Candidatus Nanoarchaeia archaeon]